MGNWKVPWLPLALSLLFFPRGAGCDAFNEAVGEGNKAFRRGDLAGAAEAYERAAALDPGNDDVLDGLLSLYRLHGERAFGEKRYADAADWFRRGLSLDPSAPDLLRGLGHALFSDQQPDRALLAFRSAAVSDPSDAEARAMAGVILYERGEMEAAIRELRSVLELDPGSEPARRFLGKALREQAVEGKFETRRDIHFDLRIDPAFHGEFGERILEFLEEAYSDLGLRLGARPPGKTVVLSYSGEAFLDLYNRPHTVAGFYDGKIRLPVSPLLRDEETLRRLLFHEYAHVVVRYLTNDNCPRWLHEGVAETVSRPWDEGELGALKRAVREGSLVPPDGLDAALLRHGSPAVRLAYDQSFSLVHRFVERYGFFQLRNLLDLLYEGRGFKEAFRDGVGASWEQFEKDWREELEKAFR